MVWKGCRANRCDSSAMVELCHSKIKPMRLVEQDSLSCALLQSMPQPAVLIWSFHTALPAPQLESCRVWLPAQMYSSVQGRPVFYAAPLLRDLVPGAAPPLDQSLAGGQLVSSPAQLDG